MAVDISARDGSSSEALAPPLSQAVGYVVVVVVGLIIAFGMVFVTRILKKTVGEDNEKTEVFMTANRSVTRGLTSSAVISSWLWSTAMLGSSLVGYQYGVSGPFWFAAGCSPMIVFFAVLGISCKRKIPEAHTLLEIVRIRYGNIAHVVYMVLCLLNNLFACANMLLGASAVITAMTGMHVIAATFLLPVGVALYTFVGGIKATFLTDYLHTFTILIILCFFTVKAFTVEEIASPSHLFEILQQAGFRHPVSGNHDGSYLTMTSKGGILFGIIHICANFGLVIMDTSFFIKAFAASPSAVVPGYVIGGIAYFAIPWALGTLASSIVLGLEPSPLFPTYPRRMTSTEVSNGLVLPYAFILVAGRGAGAACVLLITFMAVTSTLSAQVIAVSSILAFDVYRTYIRPRATDADVIRWSHYGVVGFAAFAAAFSTMLHYVGIDLGWTLYMLGIITCPGIFPTALAILWRGQSRAAAVLAPTLGMATGMAVWLGTARALYGGVGIASTGATLPCLYGTVAATVAPLPISLVVTAVTGGQGWEWSEFRKVSLAFEVRASGRDAGLEEAVEGGEGEEEAGRRLKRWGRIAAWWAVATFLGHWVLWPLPMYAAKYVFGEKFFVAWLVVAIVWLWGTLLVAGFYPLVDGRDQIAAVWKGLRSGSGSKGSSTSTSDGEGNGTDGPRSTTQQSPGTTKDESSLDVVAKAEALEK
ncbi:urea active transporter [Diplodia corticola]|uniref:Urea active transporter n=1 Tax=Diplodia corticola TaxID=236234 RepID=A0A1J9QLW1_9PEZI|nr:urea active transporter [Diplodia corticola]OJD29050.1 urea active transporter [Diplodia corticola]